MNLKLSKSWRSPYTIVKNSVHIATIVKQNLQGENSLLAKLMATVLEPDTESHSIEQRMQR